MIVQFSHSTIKHKNYNNPLEWAVYYLRRNFKIFPSKSQKKKMIINAENIS